MSTLLVFMKKEQPQTTLSCTLFTIPKTCMQPINLSVKTYIESYLQAQCSEPFGMEKFNNVARTLKFLA